ncbi:assimilatory sulfite reductase [Cylindrobasidium torrendii FP15055 ss-10]|uniref:assimilatory sulfite reductase (NADPH) n=1 Tax=Cylindrobasidium torrendii FP15055 ss-10 TaxID=1314674 RepID=A0A0D7BU99_9AGAR|nr:assimilatory sulfite reductase [Cylindrobasidium torrendii FP15055 ss-10]
MSGISTPLTASTVVSSPPSPTLKASAGSDSLFFNPRIQPFQVVEYVVSRPKTSSTIFVYDLAEQVGFGTMTKAWVKANGDKAQVVDLQTRAGAGLTLVGRLSEGTSSDATITAYTSTKGLAMMAPSLSHLPPATPTSRLVLQVPNLLLTDSEVSASLYPVASAIPIIPDGVVVFLSATPQEVVDFAQLAYKIPNQHVIHVFDHYSAAREVGQPLIPLGDISVKSDAPRDIFNAAGYKFFSYHGADDAESVLIAPNGPLALAAKAYAQKTPGFGVVVVKVLKPWDAEALLDTVPVSAKFVHVLDDVRDAHNHGLLYGEVFSTLLERSQTPNITGHRLTPAKVHQFLTRDGAFGQFLSTLVPLASQVDILSPSAKRLLLFTTPSSPLASFPYVLNDLFASNKGITTRLLSDHDAISSSGGVTANKLLLSLKKEAVDSLPLPVAIPYESSSGAVDFLAILDHTLLKSHDVLKYAADGAVVLVAAPWAPAEFEASIPTHTKSVISEKQLNVFALNASGAALSLVGQGSANKSVIETLVVNLAFLRLYLGKAATESVVLKVASAAFENSIEGISLEVANKIAWDALFAVPVAAPAADEKVSVLKAFQFNSIILDSHDNEGDAAVARLGSWHDAAKHLMFPDAFVPKVLADDREFPLNPALRPEVPEDTFLVTCTVNRRLTPTEYDRNVFHLEFDTSGTGLKYDIGEALGVHGWNDEKEVLDFISWYGIDPSKVITIPVGGEDGHLHTRTVFQALQQQVDLFGRPPKSFYTELAAYATSSLDRHALLFIGSPEGSATFKKLSEKDTVTFAEVFRMYPTAKPSVEKLALLVGDIKPRHYSIASAQAVVGDRVDLLVVTVDWLTPSGSPRYGQCTRYLSALKPGQKVTVSIKPSVMKLPADNKQPLIMAGLGTGAAPFRAFLQYRAWLQAKGEEVGPVYYYFGSRHQSQEYLYGEEIEAFIEDNVITRAGLAFSRDGPKKIYIQHKMLEDSEALATMLYDQKGVFYLCGPTWPVPDVYEALVNAFGKFKGVDATSAGEYLEGLKEEERYILEVY